MSTPEQPSDRLDAILAVRLPVEMKDAIREVAKANQRSLNGQVRWVIEQSLAHRDEPTDTAPAPALHRKAA